MKAIEDSSVEDCRFLQEYSLKLEHSKKQSDCAPGEVLDKFLKQLNDTLARELPCLTKRSFIHLLREYAQSEEGEKDSFSYISDRFFDELSRMILRVIKNTSESLSS